MKLARSARRHPEIDVTNLIDVVLILLIYFAMSTKFTKDMQVELQRPSARSAGAAPAKAVRIYVDRARRIWLDDQPIKSWMIQSRIRDQLAAAPGKKALVVVDRFVPSELLIEVVDQCRLGGAAEVGVATQAGTTE